MPRSGQVLPPHHLHLEETEPANGRLQAQTPPHADDVKGMPAKFEARHSNTLRQTPNIIGGTHGCAEPRSQTQQAMSQASSCLFVVILQKE